MMGSDMNEIFVYLSIDESKEHLLLLLIIVVLLHGDRHSGFTAIREDLTICLIALKKTKKPG
jgi:hypothetical protein